VFEASDKHLLNASVAIKSDWLLKPKKYDFEDPWSTPNAGTDASLTYPIILVRREI
jgi:hypothetical protein